MTVLLIDPVDCCDPPGALYRLMTADEQKRLAANIVRSLGAVTRKEIKLRQLGHFHRADPRLAADVAQGLGIDMAELKAPE